MKIDDIKELGECLNEYKKAQAELSGANALLLKVGKKGHSDGKWHIYPKVDVKVAYQESIGSQNYHDCSALTREVNAYISKNWSNIIEHAFNTLVENEKRASEMFDKYYIKLEKR
jgi:hypothetical protein